MVIRRRLGRAKVLEFFADLPRCLVGMEACATAHYWARELTYSIKSRKCGSPGDVAPGQSFAASSRADVKNRVDLTFELDDYLTDLIDEYVQEYRSSLLRGFNGGWLFPGTAGGSKDPHLFGIQITERIQKATGLRITIHQFRHAAAAIYLKHHPGDYETVRRSGGSWATVTSEPR